ncbi:MAG: hypothetical protein ACP5IO_03465 [Elusimicrobiales bacterium]
MKIKAFISISFFYLLVPTFINASEGIGFVIGKPSGVVLNILSTRLDKSINFTLSWKSSSDKYLKISADQIFYVRKGYEKKGYETEVFHLFYGYGGGIIFDNGTDLSLRLPLGIKKDFGNIDIFLEFTPFLKLVKETKGDADIVVGARYYFK